MFLHNKHLEFKRFEVTHLPSPKMSFAIGNETADFCLICAQESLSTNSKISCNSKYVIHHRYFYYYNIATQKRRLHGKLGGKTKSLYEGTASQQTTSSHPWIQSICLFSLMFSISLLSEWKLHFVLHPSFTNILHAHILLVVYLPPYFCL